MYRCPLCFFPLCRANRSTGGVMPVEIVPESTTSTVPPYVDYVVYCTWQGVGRLRTTHEARRRATSDDEKRGRRRKQRPDTTKVFAIDAFKSAFLSRVSSSTNEKSTITVRTRTRNLQLRKKYYHTKPTDCSIALHFILNN
jgi:hypothetical protein